MRFFSILTFASLAVISSAAPLKRGFFDDIKNGVEGAAKEIGNLVNSNATLSGVIGTIGQSIANPDLTKARIQVVKGLSDTQNALNQVKSQANSTNNAGVLALADTAQTGISQAHSAVNTIGDALVSGNKPDKSLQGQTAQGIKDARDALNQMEAAITTPDATLSNNILAAQSAVSGLQQGGLGVLSSEDIGFSDLGLPDDFAN